MADVRVVASGFSFLECPRWHDGRLWLSDFYTQQVVTVDADGRVEPVVTVSEQPSGLGWLPDGRLLVVSMRDRRILRREPDGTLVEHADLSEVATGHLNDMVVDAQGRAYVGNFGFDLMAGAPMRAAAVIRVDPDGGVEVAADGLVFPNGSVVTPDGRTLIVAETMGQRLTAFDVGPDGALSGRRTWASFGETPATTEVGDVLAAAALLPDGICLDAEGAVWVADAHGQRVVRVREGGELLAEVPVGSGVYACMLGGPDGRTLYICSAPSFAEHERRDTREGRLLAVDVDVPHAGLP